MIKRIILTLLLIATVNVVLQAQSKDIGTATTKFSDYLIYDKAEGKTESLVKAKDAIDRAITTVEEKIAAQDPKLKQKNIAKAYDKKIAIYMAMAELKGDPLSEGASEAAYEAAMKLKENDPDGNYKDNTVAAIDAMRVDAYNAGIANFKAGKYTEAYPDFVKSLEMNTLVGEVNGKATIDTAAITMAAYSAHNGKDYDNAIKHYENLLFDIELDDVKMYSSLSQIYMSNGNPEKSKEVIEKGKERYPETNEFVIAEVNQLLKEGKSTEAIGKMKEAVALYPDNASLLFALGAANEGITDENGKKTMITQAAEYYQKAIDLDPEYFDAYYNLGALYFNDAVELIKVAADLPINKQKEYDAMLAESKALFTKALPSFETAFQLNNEDLNTVIALKEIYANMGNMEKSGEFKALFDKMKDK